MRDAVNETIRALATRPEDKAAVELACLYADQIDQATGTEEPKIIAWTVRWITPLLLECLKELGATPAARDRLKRGEAPAHDSSRLKAFRTARD